MLKAQDITGQESDQIGADDLDIRTLDDNGFVESCRPALEAMEKIRRGKKIVYEFRKKIAFPAVLICTPLLAYADYWLLWLQRSNDDGGAGLSIAFLGLVYWWVTKPKREYAKAYKQEILPRIAACFGPFFYVIDGKIEMDKLRPSKIIPSYDRYGAEDYFSGTYKGVKIEFSEMHLTETRGSGKNRRTVTTFKGLTILLEMKRKKFYGHTILDHNRTQMGEWFKSKSLDLKRARMVDPEFEKLFDVYTDDQVEARYLVDPLIIEQYKDLYAHFAEAPKRDRRPRDESWVEKIGTLRSPFKEGIKGMQVAYYGDKVLIMIGSSYNHFEPADLHVPATDTTSLLHMKAEIGDILTLIDRLDLYDPLAQRRAETQS